jgi:hypothetical protein
LLQIVLHHNADHPRYTAEQYNALYCKAFAKLDELCSLAEQAMRELEELQLSMGDTDIGRKKFS